jgi:hypothetical protein
MLHLLNQPQKLWPPVTGTPIVELDAIGVVCTIEASDCTYLASVPKPFGVAYVEDNAIAWLKLLPWHLPTSDRASRNAL